jgi:hypothetical protein
MCYILIILVKKSPFDSFPECNIYQAIASDLLHNMIKGIFSDHFYKLYIEILSKSDTS